MSPTSRVLAVSTAIAAGMALCATVAAPAQASLGCRPNHVVSAYFELSVKRALLSCNVIEVGVRGGSGLPPEGAALSVWGPDSFTGLVQAQAGEYTKFWEGDHAAGAKWCASFVGDADELCITT